MPYLQYDRDADDFRQITELDGEIVERLFMREIKVFRDNSGTFEELSINPATAGFTWTPVED